MLTDSKLVIHLGTLLTDSKLVIHLGTLLAEDIDNHYYYYVEKYQQ